MKTARSKKRKPVHPGEILREDIFWIKRKYWKQYFLFCVIDNLSLFVFFNRVE